MAAEVLGFTALFATIFGLYFLRSRENLSMIPTDISMADIFFSVSLNDPKDLPNFCYLFDHLDVTEWD